MASYTTNYNLKKIALTDSPPDITELNGNFDTIDTTMKANADAISVLETSNDGKAEKDSDAVQGNIAVFDSSGNCVDGGLKFFVDSNGILNIEY